jgi:hypothetical protein
MSTNKINTREREPNGQHEGRSKISVTAEAKADRRRGARLLVRANRYLQAGDTDGWQKLVAANITSDEVSEMLNVQREDFDGIRTRTT